MYALPRTTILRAAGALLIAATAACSDDYGSTPSIPLPASTAVVASGDLTAKLTEFRGLLGDPVNGNAKGQQAGGRREVNWEGANGTNLNTNAFPVDFFNVTVARGLITTTPGTGFRVSDNDFGDVNALYAADFEKFSGTKTFAPIGSNVTDVIFRLAGDTTKATVKGFGVVFSDVDVVNGTVLEFFDVTGRRIGTVAAPVRSDANGHSLAGLVFESAIVARVRIFTGQGTLGVAKDVTGGGTVDLVVMDDFLYAEPSKL